LAPFSAGTIRAASVTKEAGLAAFRSSISPARQWSAIIFQVPGQRLAEITAAGPAQVVGVAGGRHQRARPDQHVAGEGAGEVGAEEGQVGIRHRVDVGADQLRLGRAELQVSAAERDDAGVGRGAAGDRQAVRPEAGAEDRLGGDGGAGRVLDRQLAALRAGAVDGRAEVDRAARGLDVGGVGARHGDEVDDPGVGGVEGGGAAGVRLDGGDLVGTQPT
jgi:hypothetical protein